MTTVIIDYESGNLHSAEKAFRRMADEVGAGEVLVTSDPDVVRGADRVVLPGDGAFPACRKELFDHRGLFEATAEVVRQRRQALFRHLHRHADAGHARPGIYRDPGV